MLHHRKTAISSATLVQNVTSCAKATVDGGKIAMLQMKKAQ
jgi:hypothetical protein